MAILKAPAGTLEGRDLDGACAFLGIPYAQAPIGKLRFRPPQSFGLWSGCWPAKNFGASCPQDPSEAGIPYMPLAVGATDEDCLYLNVWTPSADGKARPVFFWVHGGAFTAGSGSEPFYDGAKLAAEQDVVVVTVNYRLGALGGFLYFAELGGPLEDSANLGILDVLLALEWVRDNIAAFGGNPDCVTLAGQSAGGKLVTTILGMEQGQGLFHRLVAQSPSTPSLLEAAEAQLVASEFLKELGSDKPAEIANASAEALYKAAVPISQSMTMGPLGPPIGPMVDNKIIRAQPLRNIAAGMAKNIPILAGATTHEMELLFRKAGLDKAGDDILQGFAAILPDSARQRVVDACASASLKDLHPSAPAPVTFLLGERMVRMGTIRLLEAQLPHQPNCFSYLFEWQTEVDSGAPHCVEIPFLFGTTSAPDVPALIGTGPDVEGAGQDIRGRWTAFMRTGVPKPAGGDDWRNYTTERRETFVLGRTGYMTSDPWSVQRRAWDGVAYPGGCFMPLPNAA